LNWAALALLVLGSFVSTGAHADDALLSNAEAGQLAKHVVQLMESTSAAIPELQLASAPLVAGAGNTLSALNKQPGSLPLTYKLVTQTRAFLAISDATPKPFPFSDTAARQFTELRDGYARLEVHLAALMAAKEAQTRNPDPDNLKRYAEENGRLVTAGVNPRVVFMGDSITDFWHLNEYFTGRDFINRGISGQTTSQMLGRMKADVLDLHPRAVLILAGTNDIARETPLDIIENNLMMMTDLAHAHSVKVLIASILPAGPQQTMRPLQKIQQLNTWLQGYCAKADCTYVDYYSKLRDPSGFLQPDLADDGLHPNSKGYRLMAPIAVAAIDREVGTAQAPAAPKRHVHVF
jgi:lysophospholipase L1-like esterase